MKTFVGSFNNTYKHKTFSDLLLATAPPSRAEVLLSGVIVAVLSNTLQRSPLRDAPPPLALQPERHPRQHRRALRHHAHLLDQVKKIFERNKKYISKQQKYFCAQVLLV